MGRAGRTRCKEQDGEDGGKGPRDTGSDHVHSRRLPVQPRPQPASRSRLSTVTTTISPATRNIPCYISSAPSIRYTIKCGQICSSPFLPSPSLLLVKYVMLISPWKFLLMPLQLPTSLLHRRLRLHNSHNHLSRSKTHSRCQGRHNHLPVQHNHLAHSRATRHRRLSFYPLRCPLR